jgi:hypothetical protein
MNTFEFITNKEDIESISDELKRYSCGMENPFVFIRNGTVIVKGEMAIFEDDSVEIKMLESIKKRMGAGRTFVEYLKKMPHVHEIWGEALPNAVDFWFKMGAKFDPSSFETYLGTEDHEEGFLIPFTIACN